MIMKTEKPNFVLTIELIKKKYELSVLSTGLNTNQKIRKSLEKNIDSII